MKLLVVRFSSIGDVILTTPVLRCIKEQLKDVEVHFLTKQSFASLLEGNPHVNKIWTIEKSIDEVTSELKKEGFDEIIDLHHNIRTLSLKRKLGVKSSAFPKLNFKKWLLVRFKMNRMPDLHVVDRYFDAVKHLNVKADNGNCELFLRSTEIISPESLQITGSFVAVALGAQFKTKVLPLQQLINVLAPITEPIVLLGGKGDEKLAEELISHFDTKQIISCAGRFTIRESAGLLSQARVLLSNDTGLMHLATCFDVRIVSVWGNTVPALGMYPYYPQTKENYSIHEVDGLDCRPCSKIGFQKCPKGHFKCMLQQDTKAISEDLLKI